MNPPATSECRISHANNSEKLDWAFGLVDSLDDKYDQSPWTLLWLAHFVLYSYDSLLTRHPRSSEGHQSLSPVLLVTQRQTVDDADVEK